jgi:hypothetical protein
LAEEIFERFETYVGETKMKTHERVFAGRREGDSREVRAYRLCRQIVQVSPTITPAYNLVGCVGQHDVTPRLIECDLEVVIAEIGDQKERLVQSRDYQGIYV